MENLFQLVFALLTKHISEVPYLWYICPRCIWVYDSCRLFNKYICGAIPKSSEVALNEICNLRMQPIGKLNAVFNAWFG